MPLASLRRRRRPSFNPRAVARAKEGFQEGLVFRIDTDDQFKSPSCRIIEQPRFITSR